MRFFNEWGAVQYGAEGEQAGGSARSAPPSAYGDALAEYARFRALGVEGLFSDNGDTAVLAYS